MENNLVDKKIKGITFAGRLGSGKSSTADALAEKLGYSRMSTGRLQRELSEKEGLSFKEYSEIQKTNPNFDYEVDQKLKDFIAENKDFVLDSRLAHIFEPRLFKVFLEVDTLVAAERMFADMQSNPERATEKVASVEELIENNAHRLVSEQQRYKNLYDIDNHMNPEDFDVVINTGDYFLEQVVELIYVAYQDWLAKE